MALVHGCQWQQVGLGSPICPTSPACALLLVIRQLIRVMSSGSRAGQLYDAAAQVPWPKGCHVLSDRGRDYE